jgi:hypothetical protein
MAKHNQLQLIKLQLAARLTAGLSSLYINSKYSVKHRLFKSLPICRGAFCVGEGGGEFTDDKYYTSGGVCAGMIMPQDFWPILFSAIHLKRKPTTVQRQISIIGGGSHLFCGWAKLHKGYYAAGLVRLYITGRAAYGVIAVSKIAPGIAVFPAGIYIVLYPA